MPGRPLSPRAELHLVKIVLQRAARWMERSDSREVLRVGSSMGGRTRTGLLGSHIRIPTLSLFPNYMDLSDVYNLSLSLSLVFHMQFIAVFSSSSSFFFFFFFLRGGGAYCLSLLVSGISSPVFWVYLATERDFGPCVPLPCSVGNLSHVLEIWKVVRLYLV